MILRPIPKILPKKRANWLGRSAGMSIDIPCQSDRGRRPFCAALQQVTSLPQSTEVSKSLTRILERMASLNSQSGDLPYTESVWVCLKCTWPHDFMLLLSPIQEISSHLLKCSQRRCLSRHDTTRYRDFDLPADALCFWDFLILLPSFRFVNKFTPVLQPHFSIAIALAWRLENPECFDIELRSNCLQMAGQSFASSSVTFVTWSMFAHLRLHSFRTPKAGGMLVNPCWTHWHGHKAVM